MDQGQYASAGGAIIGVLFLLLVVGLVVFQPFVDRYIGLSATTYIVLLILGYLTQAIVNPLLSGLQLVHVRDLISGFRVLSRSGLQIALISLGLGTVGLFVGHIVAFLVATAIALYVISGRVSRPKWPERRHVVSLLDFAKYSWLGNLRGRMINYTDILVLGFFISQSMIGVYAVAWNIARFLTIFSDSVSSTLFPAMSELSTKRNPQAVGDIFEESLAYGGVFVVPALFGGALLGERVLRIYGPEFTQGATILVILIVANLVRSYQSQFLNTLNGVDRPDLAFRVNGGFVVANLVLNVVLVYLYGWIGAAVATATSVAISLVLAHRHLGSVIEFRVPFPEIYKQCLAAFVMAAVLYGCLQLEDTYRILGHNLALVLLLVGGGAGIYFLTLFAISPEFRTTVNRNVPLFD